jgi:hypothetical protein
MHIDYALLCEFSTVSNNGLHSFMHVFDKTMFKPGSPLGVRGILAAKFSEVPAEAELEIYLTDENNVVLDKGHLMKIKVKGPFTQIVSRFGLLVPDVGVYTFWARMDGGEPMRLVQWTAEEKSA